MVFGWLTGAATGGATGGQSWMTGVFKKMFGTTILGHILQVIWSNKARIFKVLVVDYYIKKLLLLGVPVFIVNRIKGYLDYQVTNWSGGSGYQSADYTNADIPSEEKPSQQKKDDGGWFSNWFGGSKTAQVINSNSQKHDAVVQNQQALK